MSIELNEKPPTNINTDLTPPTIPPQTIENLNHNQNINNLNGNNINPPKKNRQLQFYKFLFYSNKIEIQLQDFLSLVRTSNQTEIMFWILSVILYCNSPNNQPEYEANGRKYTYNGGFIWAHLFHIVRGFLGLYIVYVLPRTFQLIDKLQNLNESILEKKFFNDIMREFLNENVLNVISKKKIHFLFYLSLTGLNLGIDLFDFFFLLSMLDKSPSESKVVLITYLFISLVYIIIDLSYVLWSFSLKYILPKEYLEPILNAFDGLVGKAKKVFKIGKKESDIKKEFEVKGPEQPPHKLPEVKDQIISNNSNTNTINQVNSNSINVNIEGINNNNNIDNLMNNNNNFENNMAIDNINNMNVANVNLPLPNLNQLIQHQNSGHDNNNIVSGLDEVKIDL